MRRAPRRLRLEPNLLLHAAYFFGALAVATTLVAMIPRAISSRIWIGLPVGLVLIGITASFASVLSGSPALDNALAVIALVVVVLARLWQMRWSWLGAQLFATACLAAIAYLLFAGQLTFETVRGPVYVVASVLLLLLELAALLL